jgi:hypothetical protein
MTAVKALREIVAHVDDYPPGEGSCTNNDQRGFELALLQAQVWPVNVSFGTVDEDLSDRPNDLDELILRLRSLQRLTEPPHRNLPKRPDAKEALVDVSDIPHRQGFGQKIAGRDACNHEGWYWSWDPRAGHFPISVWCGRPYGHDGPHEARTGITLHRHKIKVLQWEDAVPNA